MYDKMCPSALARQSDQFGVLEIHQLILPFCVQCLGWANLHTGGIAISNDDLVDCSTITVELNFHHFLDDFNCLFLAHVRVLLAALSEKWQTNVGGHSGCDAVCDLKVGSDGINKATEGFAVTVTCNDCGVQERVEFTAPVVHYPRQPTEYLLRTKGAVILAEYVFKQQVIHLSRHALEVCIVAGGCNCGILPNNLDSLYGWISCQTSV
mmetsp:Transcript_132930/g.230514  ORF Transcript_132930/g.230514 Transcript_132930/m.230514 type:complete len:209 (-) Transcript_132930:106-732(-)